MNSSRQIYILSGGAGTRLWPLSRETHPKQFYDLAGTGRALMVETAERLARFGQLHILTTQSLRFASMGLLSRLNISAKVVGEPIPRNTAAAVALATWQSLRADAQSVVGIFPADHLIKDRAVFGEALNAAFDEAETGKILTLGIHPTHASTAYGYIELEKNAADHMNRAAKVQRFVEKPPVEKAEELIRSGKAVWNAGIFIFKARTMADEFRKQMPELWGLIEQIKADESNLAEIYPRLPSISVDYGVMEKARELFCVPTPAMGWSDVGSWEEVAKHTQTLGRPVQVKAKNNFYAGMIPDEKRIAFVGVEDLVVVDTPDALLVARKGEGQSVREAVEELKKEKAPQTHHHVFEERPWGRFEVLMDTPFFKSKRISMWPKQRLSYQSHSKRAEHWVVVRGEARVTLDGKDFDLKAGDHIFIPLQAKHRIANPGTDVMEFIEVQTGSYFGEDDIQRFEDDYGRS